jgi:hypothetical protein
MDATADRSLIDAERMRRLGDSALLGLREEEADGVPTKRSPRGGSLKGNAAAFDPGHVPAALS